MKGLIGLGREKSKVFRHSPRQVSNSAQYKNGENQESVAVTVPFIGFSSLYTYFLPWLCHISKDTQLGAEHTLKGQVGSFTSVKLLISEA